LSGLGGLCRLEILRVEYGGWLLNEVSLDRTYALVVYCLLSVGLVLMMMIIDGGSCGV
jgi:hypothetical protein